MKTARIVSLLICIAGVTLAGAGPGDPAGSLEDDFQRLRGTWVRRAPGLEWKINFDGRAVQIALSGPWRGFARAGTGWLSEVKEDAQGRFVELEPHTARATELPQRIYYTFDRDDLVLDIGEGPLKGQHVFVRDQGPAQFDTPWIIGGVLLTAVLLAGVVILLRKRFKKAAHSESADVKPPGKNDGGS